MNSFTGVVLFIVLAAFSLTIVSLANRAQTRQRVIRLKTQQLTRRINELEETTLAIEPLVESTLVPAQLNEEIIDLVHSVKKLDPRIMHLDINLQQAQEAQQQLRSGARTQPLNRLMQSDAAIAKAKYHLNEAARVIRRHAAVNRLSTTEMESFIEDLAWANLMVDVVTRVGHGHRAVTNSQPVMAYNFYRSAQNVLLASNVRDERRNRVIREIKEILENKRSAISIELMPESGVNPKANTMNLPDSPPVGHGAESADVSLPGNAAGTDQPLGHSG